MSNSTETKTSGTDTRGILYPATIAFCVALGTLLLQLVQTRIYGVVFWNHLVYFIVSIALLGFGISGTWLAFGESTRLARFLTFRNAALGFVVSTIVASLLAPRMGISIAVVVAGSPRILQLLFTYALGVFPYFFAGWMLGAVFRDWANRIFVLYFVDLVGAGLGCLLYLGAMQLVGAIHLVLFVCFIVALPPLLHDIRRPSTKGFAIAIVAVLIFLGVNERKLNASIQPEPMKAFKRLYMEMGDEDVKDWEVSEWNTISRIDVVQAHLNSGKKLPFINRKIVYIDGDAWTGMILGKYWQTPMDRTNAFMAGPGGYHFITQGDVDKVLVIGSGGGADVASALWNGANEVDAVEINPTTYRLLLEEYGEVTNNLFNQPSVHAYNEEGRSFVRRTDKKYDAIVMTGIDTFAAINSGAYVLSENYLYTIEGMTDYLNHLTDKGILNITRWLHYAETPRLFVVCYEALKNVGFDHPEKHIIMQGVDRATIMVRLTPFTDQEIRDFGDHLAAKGATLHYPAHEKHEIHGVIDQYVQRRIEGTHEEFLDSLTYDITPVTDDRPFFFHFDKPSHLRAILYERSLEDFVRGHWPSFTLFSLFAFTCVAVLAFMFIPLARRGHVDIPHFKTWLVYFTCLGVSFIFVEIALMQRFALLLGHPSRSLALGLSSLLIFAGIGSQLRGMLQLNLKAMLAALVVMILAAAYVYPFIIDAVLGWSFNARAIVTLALVAPLGMLMGMPFPSGIHAVSKHGAEAVPWMWGINGGTTVLGSVLAIIIAIWGNFTTVLNVAAAGYLLALLVFWVITRDAHSDAEA